MNSHSIAAWSAPIAEGPIRATVTIPGSKSITNRALVLAALADGVSTVAMPLRSRDTLLMVEALRALGTTVIDEPNGSWTVSPGEFAGPATVDCGLAGTVMRFVPPVAVLANGPVQFDGDEHARTRPMNTVLAALRALGGEITGDRLPFTVHGHGELAGGQVDIDASGSSQFVSGLLLSGARYTHGVTVRHSGKPVPSLPHIDMTIAMLRNAGVSVTTDEPNTWRVAPGKISALSCVIEPDLSNATPFLAAAAVTGGTVTIPHWPTHTTQAGNAIQDVLTAMGCTISRSNAGLTVQGTGKLSGVDLDLRDFAELTPTIAALAALADGPSQLRGIAHIRGHETDRLAALRVELTNRGCLVEETEDGLYIQPRPLTGGLWRAYADHRMATAGAILGLVVPGIAVDDILSTTKTIPDFPGMWSAMLGRSAELSG